jgi:hypothetical protein
MYLLFEACLSSAPSFAEELVLFNCACCILNLRRIVIAIDHDDRIAFFRSFPVPHEELFSARRSYATTTTVF